MTKKELMERVLELEGALSVIQMHIDEISKLETLPVIAHKFLLEVGVNRFTEILGKHLEIATATTPEALEKIQINALNDAGIVKLESLRIPEGYQPDESSLN